MRVLNTFRSAGLRSGFNELKNELHIRIDAGLYDLTSTFNQFTRQLVARTGADIELGHGLNSCRRFKYDDASSLLQFPPEIRNMIWESALLEMKHIILPCPFPALLKVCRQTRNEGGKIFMAMNNFCILPDLYESQRQQRLQPRIHAWLYAATALGALKYMSHVDVFNGFQSELLGYTFNVPDRTSIDWTCATIDLRHPLYVRVAVKVFRQSNSAITASEYCTLERSCQTKCTLLFVQNISEFDHVRNALSVWKRLLKIVEQTHRTEIDARSIKSMEKERLRAQTKIGERKLRLDD